MNAREIQATWDREAAAIKRGALDRPRSTTYVYVIGIQDAARPVKIGVAEDIKKRMLALQTGSPQKLELKAAFLLSTRREAAYTEVVAHAHFSSARQHGEWFDIDASEAEAYLSASLVGNEAELGRK